MRIMAFVLAVTAGCSSPSTGVENIDRAAQAAALEAALAGENISDPAALPLEGTANYAGFMTLNLPTVDGRQANVGDLNLAVDFGATSNQVSGGVSNFSGTTGTLDISGGDLNRGADPDMDFTFDGALSGTLQTGSTAFDIDGNLLGEFRGRDQYGLTGIVSGTITGSGSQDIFDESMAATRTD